MGSVLQGVDGAGRLPSGVVELRGELHVGLWVATHAVSAPVIIRGDVEQVGRAHTGVTGLALLRHPLPLEGPDEAHEGGVAGVHAVGQLGHIEIGIVGDVHLAEASAVGVVGQRSHEAATQLKRAYAVVPRTEVVVVGIDIHRQRVAGEVLTLEHGDGFLGGCLTVGDDDGAIVVDGYAYIIIITVAAVEDHGLTVDGDLREVIGNDEAGLDIVKEQPRVLALQVDSGPARQGCAPARQMQVGLALHGHGIAVVRRHGLLAGIVDSGTDERIGHQHMFTFWYTR